MPHLFLSRNLPLINIHAHSSYQCIYNLDFYFENSRMPIPSPHSASHFIITELQSIPTNLSSTPLHFVQSVCYAVCPWRLQATYTVQSVCTRAVWFQGDCLHKCFYSYGTGAIFGLGDTIMSVPPIIWGVKSSQLSFLLITWHFTSTTHIFYFNIMWHNTIRYTIFTW